MKTTIITFFGSLLAYFTFGGHIYGKLAGSHRWVLQFCRNIGIRKIHSRRHQ